MVKTTFWKDLLITTIEAVSISGNSYPGCLILKYYTYYFTAFLFLDQYIS